MVVALCALCSIGLGVGRPAEVISWKGYKWTVREGSGGPGPNTFHASNVFVDSAGDLHLRITQKGSEWSCAEVDSDAQGFGTYQWQVEGPIDRLDKNVVLGLFGYKGPDGVDEIDVEFARWGNEKADNGNWTVYPSSGKTQGSFTFPFTLNGTYTTSRYEWTSRMVSYSLLGGHQPVGSLVNVMNNWTYAPADPHVGIPQVPLPVCMNLWLFDGHAPSDGKAVEIVIHDFKRVSAGG